MLDNIVGTEGLPSSKLIGDLHTLCALGRENLSAITQVLAGLPEDVEEDEMWSALLEGVRSLKTEPEKLRTSVNVAVFLWGLWSRRGLSRDQIVSDLQSLDIPPEQLTDVQPLLDTMADKLVIVQRQREDSNALTTGTPRIESSVCVVDARLVFKSSKYDKDAGDEQLYFELDRFIPIATLELVSELNDEKATHAYLLTGESLDQLCGILDRARKRLRMVKRGLRVADDKDRGGDD